MFSREKQKRIYELQTIGIIGQELCPVPTSDYRSVAYWHWEVLQPDKLPANLRAEYDLYGEVRN